jgi:hypothetical protein
MKQNEIITNKLLLFSFNGTIVNKVILYLGQQYVVVSMGPLLFMQGVGQGLRPASSEATTSQHAADLLVAEESMAGLGSVAATATAREKGEKYNLLHERFPKLGAPLTVVLVCFAQGVGSYLLGENSSSPHQLAIWY